MGQHSNKGGGGGWEGGKRIPHPGVTSSVTCGHFMTNLRIASAYAKGTFAKRPICHEFA